MSEQDKWIFDANFQGDPFTSRCSNKMGNIHTTFAGYGTAILEYGGCGKGRVEVHLNDVRIDFIDGAETSKRLEFHFSPHSTLELRETEDESIIDLISLEVGCRGTLHYQIICLVISKINTQLT